MTNPITEAARHARIAAVLRLLRRTRGNVTLAARLAGIAREQLYGLIRRYELADDLRMIRREAAGAGAVSPQSRVARASAG